jgi:hypothetical protein
MLNTNPIQQNQQKLAKNVPSGTTTSPEEKVQSVQLDETRLPENPIPAESLHYSQNILRRQYCGIAYADVLKSLTEKSWYLSDYPHKDSLDLTHRLVGLNPHLARELQSLASSERFIDYALALIPFTRRPLPSTRFLEANKGINQIIEDLEKSGLVCVSHFVARPSSVDSHTVGFGSSFFILSPTDLGLLALRALQ